MILSSLFIRFSPIQQFIIRDHSMEPAIHAGDIVIAMRFLTIQKKDIILFKRDNKIFIKRVLRKNKNTFFVEGDNGSDSFDSRKFGEIKKSDIFGKVIYKL